MQTRIKLSEAVQQSLRCPKYDHITFAASYTLSEQISCHVSSVIVLICKDKVRIAE